MILMLKTVIKEKTIISMKAIFWERVYLKYKILRNIFKTKDMIFLNVILKYVFYILQLLYNDLVSEKLIKAYDNMDLKIT